MASFNKRNSAASAANKTANSQAVRKIAQATPDTHNLAGGQAFRLTPHYELAFQMLTSFLEPEFYRSVTGQVQAIRNSMIKVNDPLFTAKAAIYARTQYGMRSISHLIAADIAKGVKGQTWTKNFFDKVVYRVDDAAEILAAYLSLHGKPIPNSLKKGLALSLSKFNSHQLAKYKGNNKGVKLVDLFNLVHPKPNAENAAAYKSLIEGELASSDTWESELSAAGQEAKSEVEKEKNKAEAWKKLITGKKIGYFALLRNLRNIIQQADDATVDAACDLLKSEKLIQKSLVLPFRYMTAQNELQKMTEEPQRVRKVMRAVEAALDIAMKNVPKFEGSTLVVLDTSGSMVNFDSATPHGWTAGFAGLRQDAVLDPKCPAAIGMLFAAVIAKANDADLMQFADRASYINYNPTNSVSGLVGEIRAQFKSGGTNFHAIFQAANKAYDRIIILSDMQGWQGYSTPQTSFVEYCKRTKARSKIYSFDLKGYGTLQFPQDGVYALAGFSEKTLDLMKILEVDPQNLIKQINAIEL